MQIETYERRAKNNVSESTLKSRKSALKNLKDFMEHDGEPEVEDVEKWVDDMIRRYENEEIKSGTIKQYFNCARYYFEMVHGSDEPISHIRKWIPTGDTDHGDYLTREEWNTLIDHVTNIRDKAIVQLMYEYARRPGEVILLNKSDVDLEKETITFTILKKKEPLRAKFELRPHSKKALEDHLQYCMNKEIPADNPWEEGTVEPLFCTDRGRISYDSVWKMIKKNAMKADIPKNITPKSMRHSRATHLDWAGHSPEEIARHQLVHDPGTDVISAYIHDRSEEQVREPMVIDDE